MIYTVAVTRAIPESGIKMLKKKGYNVKVSRYNRVLKPRELKKFVKGADAILCLLTDKIDKSVLDAAGPQLKIVANYAVGYDNINVNDLKSAKVKGSNTPGVLTDSVADHAFALLMSIAKRIPEADVFTKKGMYKGWAPMLFLGGDIAGKTLGIVGMGRIGFAVAKRAQGFGMNIIYNDYNGANAKIDKHLKTVYKSLGTVIRQADYLSVHVPLLPTTRHLISTKQFNAMKKTSYLINTSRGPVVNEKALVKALKKGQIAGVALDVFEKEPKVARGLKRMQNAILTPHIASASVGTRSAMSEIAAKNIIACLSNKKLPNKIA